MRGRNTV